MRSLHRPSDWIGLFERLGPLGILPRRTTVVSSATDAEVLYAALYDPRDFDELEVFELWLAFSSPVLRALLRDGPLTPVTGFRTPLSLPLSGSSTVPGPSMRQGLRSTALPPQLSWIQSLTPILGVRRDDTSLECHTMEGWLTLFSTPDERQGSHGWVRLDPPHPDWTDHVVSDLATGLPNDVFGTGSLMVGENGRIYFKPAAVFLDALNHPGVDGHNDFAKCLLSALRRGEQAYLPGVGMISVTLARTSSDETQRRPLFTPEPGLLDRVDDALEARTLPPRRR